MNFQYVIPSLRSDKFIANYFLGFDLTSMQNATQNFQYKEWHWEVGKLVLNFTNFALPLDNLTEFIVLGNWMSSVAVEKFDLNGRNIQKRQRYSPEFISRLFPL